MILTAFICLIAAGFVGLALAYWRAPYFADLYSGHASTSFHPVMAGRYVAFAGFAVIAAIWDDLMLVAAIFGVFAVTALIDFMTYANERGGAFKHLAAFGVSAAISIWACVASAGAAA